jgi:alpha-tubulin suppressor-like RCC1 family protein
LTAPDGPPLTNIPKVVAGTGLLLPTFCAIDTSQVLWCWGSSVDGILGNGSTDESTVATPVLAAEGGPRFSPVAQVSIGTYSACAVKADHTLWCWGQNVADQLGIGSNEQGSLYPVQVGSLSSLIMNVSVFDSAACAVRSDGTVWCWGFGAYGQLGTGASSNGYASSPVQILTAAGGPPLANVKSVNVMEYSTCAVKTDSSLWCWGAGLGGAHSLLPALWSENGAAVTDVMSLGLGTICPCFVTSDGLVHTDGSSGGTQPVATPISCD